MSHTIKGANTHNATAQRVYDEHVSSVAEALPDEPRSNMKKKNNTSTQKKRTKGKTDTRVKVNKKAARRVAKEAGDRTTFFTGHAVDEDR